MIDLPAAAAAALHVSRFMPQTPLPNVLVYFYVVPGAAKVGIFFRKAPLNSIISNGLKTGKLLLLIEYLFPINVLVHLYRVRRKQWMVFILEDIFLLLSLPMRHPVSSD